MDAVVADCEEAKHGDRGDQSNRAKPAKTLFNGVAALHAFLADIGGEGGPAVGCGLDGSTFLVGCFEESVSPISGVKAEGTGISADDTFAQDATGELLIAILLFIRNAPDTHQRTLEEIVLSVTGTGSDQVS